MAFDMYDSDSDHNNMTARNPKHSIECFFGIVNTANLFTIP